MIIETIQMPWKYSEFHEELGLDVMRSKMTGVRDKSVQRRITNLSRNKNVRESSAS